jgi:hypothetical protein
MNYIVHYINFFEPGVEMNRPVPLSAAAVAISPFKTVERAKAVEAAYKQHKSIGFTATSSLKSMGRIPRASGQYEVGNKYLAILKKK